MKLDSKTITALVAYALQNIPPLMLVSCLQLITQKIIIHTKKFCGVHTQIMYEEGKVLQEHPTHFFNCFFFNAINK